MAHGEGECASARRQKRDLANPAALQQRTRMARSAALIQCSRKDNMPSAARPETIEVIIERSNQCFVEFEAA